MDIDLKPLLAGAARQAIAGLGTYLGFTGSTETQFVGAGMVIASLGWEWWQNRGQAKFIALLAKMKPVAAPEASVNDAVKAAKNAVALETAK